MFVELADAFGNRVLSLEDTTDLSLSVDGPSVVPVRSLGFTSGAGAGAEGSGGAAAVFEYTAASAGTYVISARYRGNHVGRSPATVTASTSPAHAPCCVLRAAGAGAAAAAAAKAEGGAAAAAAAASPAAASRGAALKQLSSLDAKAASASSPTAPAPALPAAAAAAATLVTAGEAITVTIQAADKSGVLKSIGGDRFAVGGAGPNGAVATGRVTDNGDGSYTAEFTPTAAGAWAVRATLEGAGDVGGSPLQAFVLPAALCPERCTLLGAGAAEAAAGVAAHITVAARDAFDNAVSLTDDHLRAFAVTVSGGGEGAHPVSAKLRADGSADYRIVSAGSHTLSVTYNGAHVKGSPALIRCAPSRASAAASRALPLPAAVRSGGSVSVRISATDAFGNALSGSADEVAVVADGPSGPQRVPATLESSSASLSSAADFVAEVPAEKAGLLTLTALVNGAAVQGTPHTMSVDPEPADARIALLGAPSAAVAGSGYTFAAALVDSQGRRAAASAAAAPRVALFPPGAPPDASPAAEAAVSAENGGSFAVAFTPTTAGAFELRGCVGGGAWAALQPLAVTPGALAAAKCEVATADGESTTAAAAGVTAVAGSAALLRVLCRDSLGNPIPPRAAAAQLLCDAAGSAVAASVSDEGADGAVCVRLVATAAGDHSVWLRASDGSPLPGAAPLRLRVLPAAADPARSAAVAATAEGGAAAAAAALRSAAGALVRVEVRLRDRFGNEGASASDDAPLAVEAVLSSAAGGPGAVVAFAPAADAKAASAAAAATPGVSGSPAGGAGAIRRTPSAEGQLSASPAASAAAAPHRAPAAAHRPSTPSSGAASAAHKPGIGGATPGSARPGPPSSARSPSPKPASTHASGEPPKTPQQHQQTAAPSRLPALAFEGAPSAAGAWALRVTVGGAPLPGWPKLLTVDAGAASAAACLVSGDALDSAQQRSDGGGVVCGAPVALLLRARDRWGNLRAAGGDAVSAECVLEEETDILSGQPPTDGGTADSSLAARAGNKAGAAGSVTAAPAEVSDAGDGSYLLRLALPVAGAWRLRLTVNGEAAPPPLPLIRAVFGPLLASDCELVVASSGGAVVGGTVKVTVQPRLISFGRRLRSTEAVAVRCVTPGGAAMALPLQITARGAAEAVVPVSLPGDWAVSATLAGQPVAGSPAAFAAAPRAPAAACCALQPPPPAGGVSCVAGGQLSFTFQARDSFGFLPAAASSSAASGGRGGAASAAAAPFSLSIESAAAAAGGGAAAWAVAGTVEPAGAPGLWRGSATLTRAGAFRAVLTPTSAAETGEDASPVVWAGRCLPGPPAAAKCEASGDATVAAGAEGRLLLRLRDAHGNAVPLGADSAVRVSATGPADMRAWAAEEAGSPADAAESSSTGGGAVVVRFSAEASGEYALSLSLQSSAAAAAGGDAAASGQASLLPAPWRVRVLPRAAAPRCCALELPAAGLTCVAGQRASFQFTARDASLCVVDDKAAPFRLAVVSAAGEEGEESEAAVVGSGACECVDAARGVWRATVECTRAGQFKAR